MKKRSVRVLGAAMALFMGVVLTACGSSSDSAGSAKYAATETAADYGVYEQPAMAEEMADYDTASGSSTEQVQDTSRKLIKTVNLETETEDLEQTVALVEQKVRGLGGYIESSNIYNGTSYSGRSSRSASITARIPAANLDAFVDVVEGNTNITRKSVNVDDITLTYVDIESKRNSLRTEEKRLLEILESAETVEDLITVEDKLADVRYELESIESQIRSYDNLVDYSTVYLNIDEVVKFTPVEKESAFKRMGKGFMENLSDVGEAIVEFFVWFVSHIPGLLVFVLIILIIVLIIRKISVKSKAKKAARMQAAYQASMQSQPVNTSKESPVQKQEPEKGNDGNK
ncbi:DUF4349 domain-containing protein [Butyrivibrio sp. XPD2006]|uniref:DUF4349 domain-containing protein n=1 Tax=Butyrivibrio sp. XPD2006 TaxID=1280668 RepID=UPI0003B5E62D|nr:DUF4349 domain-containing protein [Butyrivibrio sp. XPD2006]